MISHVLALNKVRNVTERRLESYRRCNFAGLYYRFNVHALGEYDSWIVRQEHKNIILKLAKVQDLMWKIAERRRMIQDWNDFILSELHEWVFEMLMIVRDIFERIINTVNIEKTIIQNALIDLRNEKKLTSDDVYNIMPHAQIESFKIFARQIFKPVINKLIEIENMTLRREVEGLDDKLRELEEMMFISFLPYFEYVYENTVEIQAKGVW